MTIHKAGFKTITLILIVSLVFTGCICFFITGHSLLKWILWASILIFDILIIAFFRMPKRDFNLDENAVLCPADGKIVIIEKVFEPEYLKKEVIQISVFMSPLNVHVNRSPVSGEIIYSKHHQGKYLVAWHPKSSTKNEHTSVVFKTKNNTEILVRQIAGAVARRIICNAKEGTFYKQSDEFGFIKFGSRVDVFVPVETSIHVKTGQKVKGGITHLAYL